MTDVSVTCGWCDTAVAVHAESVVLRVDVAPTLAGELLFGCPICGTTGVQPVEGDPLARLLIVGIQPLALSEPTLEACDQPPPGARFDWQDLLDWHQQLDDVASVVPWE
jgi:hypothetical protein